MTEIKDGRKRPLVLVVDDDETIRVILPEALGAVGFEVGVAKDGLECLSAFEKLRPDIVLMDVLMPGMDGFAACSGIRNCPGGEYVPVLMMTGLEDVESINRAYEAGATDFVAKPVNCTILGHRIRYMLRAKDTLDSLQNTERRLASAQRIAQLGSWEWDIDGDSLRVSDEICRIFGVPRDSFDDRLEGLFTSVHPDDLDQVRSRFDAARKEKAPFSFTHRVLWADGTERIVHQEAKPDSEESGNGLQFLGTAQDITDRKRAEQKAYQLGLLSDTVTVIAGSTDFEDLAARIVERLHHTLEAERVGIFNRGRESGESGFHLVKGFPSSVTDGNGKEAASFELSERHIDLIGRATETARLAVADSGGTSYAVPMTVRDECLGCLFLDGRYQRPELDTSDLDFLQALASQLAVAMDRAYTAELEQRGREKERKRLESELEELRQVLKKTELVYCSEQMEALLNIIRRVATTDATILVTGDSGTGKDLVARTIHKLSPRSKKPLVVVDCAAIPPSLIESELFGHEKGAYTGAQQRRVGRLVEAEGGTVILDEIGELPLETQSKLLRFVQEKQITPVGGTRLRKVDARLVAVTNRDLAKEVADWKFREDLYFRLNVVRLHVPRLQQRPDDILHLADHFLEKFSVQYQKKTTCHLSGGAAELLQNYPWPGNVRELQNRILQAVILSEGEEIGPEQLGLTDEEMAETSRPDPMGDFHDGQNGTPVKPRAPIAGTAPPAAPPNGKRPPAVVWQELRAALRKEIDTTLARKTAPMPVGRWLIEDLILEAHRAANQVMSQGAVRVGIPEATFRRRVKKALMQKEAGLSLRSASWTCVQTLLAEVVEVGVATGGDLLKNARRILLKDVMSCIHDDVSLGSALMGVTVPTFQRWVHGEDDSKI